MVSVSRPFDSGASQWYPAGVWYTWQVAADGKNLGYHRHSRRLVLPGMFRASLDLDITTQVSLHSQEVLLSMIWELEKS